MTQFDSSLNGHKATEFLPGDIIEVRSWPEIAATLDEKGNHENLPFMREMLAFCGRTFRVSRRAFKTCIDEQNMRELKNTVFLEDVRCDGGSHGGCDKGCLIFWKEEWLKPAGSPERTNGSYKQTLTESDLAALTEREGQFVCQSSEIINASTPLPWWYWKQYVWDLSRNRVSLVSWLRSLSIAVYNKIAYLGGFNGWGSVVGNVSSRFDFEPLNLGPGDLVRVKSLSQIKATLDSSGKHEHLLFAPAMARFCGRVLRVRNRVDQIILEGTRRQRKLKDTVVLEEAICDGICHRMCPRQSFLFWRECWLEKVEAD